MSRNIFTDDICLPRDEIFSDLCLESTPLKVVAIRCISIWAPEVIPISYLVRPIDQAPTLIEILNSSVFIR